VGIAGSVPAAIERIVRRCLETDPAQRFQSARDLGFALEALGPGSGLGETETELLAVLCRGAQHQIGEVRARALRLQRCLIALHGEVLRTSPAGSERRARLAACVQALRLELGADTTPTATMGR